MAVSNNNLEFYLARVAQAREEAEAATLEHVRERCRRSEAAWTAMASRAHRSEQLKAAEAQRKAQEAPSKRVMNQNCQKTGGYARKTRERAGKAISRIIEPRIAPRAFDPVAYAAALEVLG